MGRKPAYVPSRLDELSGKAKNVPIVDLDSKLATIVPLMEKGFSSRNGKKAQIPYEEIEKRVDEYFQYCIDNNLKPSRSGLALSIGVGNIQLANWLKDPAYGDVHELIVKACQVMEVFYIERLDKYPTGTIFMLKAQHGFKEVSQIDVNSTTGTNVDDIEDAIKRLGLTPKE